MQSQIRDVRGRPITGINGAKLCWLTLADETGKVITRVGTFALCPDCDPKKVDPKEIRDSLASSSISGVTGEEVEFSKLPKMGIEIIKVYEEI